MFDQIENLIKGYAQEVITGNKDIPSDKNAAAADAASSSIMDVLKQKMSSGDGSSLINSFKDEDALKETTTEMSGNFAQKLSGLGIDLDKAKTIAISLIPMIMSKFSQSSGKSGFNVQDMLAQLGGKGGNFDLSSLGNLFGQSEGKKDANDSKGDDGLMGKLKDLF